MIEIKAKERRDSLFDIFGILKNKLKKRPQELKDEARTGWG